MKFFEKLFQQKEVLDNKLRFMITDKDGATWAGAVLMNTESIKFQFEAMSLTPDTAIEMAKWILKMNGSSVLEEIKEMKDDNNEKM